MPWYWHDLMENPDDLPETDGTYLAALDIDGLAHCYAVVRYDAENCYWSLPGGVVGWVEIEPFGGY